MQNQNNPMALEISDHEPLRLNDLVHLQDKEKTSESSLQQALREKESLWMKHHNHYAQVLDTLMLKVEAARGIV